MQPATWTYFAHPEKSRYELMKAWRSDESLVHSTTNLRDMLDYLVGNYPYR